MTKAIQVTNPAFITALTVQAAVSPSGEEGYSAEVLGAKGQTLAVIAVAAKSLEALRDDEVLSVRAMAL
ncbi:MAG TPA: hypothetical protein VGP68_18605 [Gemmataceae bacterium]|nr:hypothetical protein [Gemmataceae bacterium]